MKKLFTLVIALFALTFCANAQVTFLNESFDGTDMPSGWTTIDSDGDGYQWMPSLNVSTGFHSHSGDGCITSASYINNIGALTPDNWLITPQLAVSAGDSISFWVRGQDASYCSEVFGVYISTTTSETTAFTSVYQGVADSIYEQISIDLNAYAGQNIYVAIRHYNVSDMYWLNVDDVQFGSLPTTPTISDLSDIDFGQVALNTTSLQTVSVIGYSLTNDITVTTAAPFAVSADGTTFGTTATLTATTGVGNTTNATLYVQCTPTTAGATTGSLTLASTGATTVTANLTLTGISCTVSTFPYQFSFDNDGMASCWDIIDANNDGKTFTIASGYAYYTYSSSNVADDWLISPEFTFTGNEMASFDYWVGLTSFPERFMVYAMGADTTLLVDTVYANNGSSAPLTQYIPLNTLNGSYRIGIHCISEEDQYRLYIDNFSVTSATTSMSVNPASIDFGIVPASNTGNATFVATILNASNDITVTTAAPFNVSLDGNTYATSVTIPTPSTSVMTQTIYVGFTPTAGTTYTGEVVLSTTGAADTVVLAGEGIVCDVITTLPFNETFDETSSTRDCWQVVDANNDGTTISFMAYDDNNTGVAAYFYDSDNDANDWLISPEITLPTGGAFLSYDYAASGSSYPEKYSVWVIPQNGTIATAVNILATQTVATSNITNNILDLSSYGNQTIRVAFKVESDADMNYIFFDNVSVNAAGEASISVNPTSMSFSGLVNSATSAQTANVVAMGLTNDVNITATAPFEVSVDGNAFAATATIPQATVLNTTIYVRMNATTAGAQTGTVNLTSGTATATIALNGSAIDCSGAQALPFTEGFESDLAECWQNIDNDGDGNSWRSEEATDEKPAHSGSFSYTSESYINYVGALTPDNWLITPALAIPAEGATLAWWVAAQDPDYPADHYEVKVSTSTTLSSFTTVHDETIASGDWEERTVNLNNYAGQTIYIAFVHNNCTDNFRMKIDDISVTPGVGINDNENNVSIYPNPANNVVNVNAASNINNVEIFNMMGQRVAVIDANDTNVQINTTALSNGMYLMRITTENGVSNQKFTVAR